MNSQYELEQARQQGGQDAYRRITLVSLLIIILIALLLIGDSLIEYGRNSDTPQIQTFSNPIYQADAIPTSTVPASPIEEGTTVNKPGKP